MADFDKAYLVVADNEGGYTNDKDDSGGETVFGLSRNNWPAWNGWAEVDRLKTLPNGIKQINASTTLKTAVKMFFRSTFWDAVKGDQINDQQLATQAFDTSVNMGDERAKRWLQQTANVKVDGIIGPVTLASINALNGKVAYNRFIEYRKAMYESIIEHNPSQIKFKASWFNRMPPYKE